MPKIQAKPAIQMLKKYDQWVCWQGVMDEKTRKVKKPPFNPKTGRSAKVNDKTTWGSYEQAIKGHQYYGFDGLGFMFYPKALPIVGIDIDNCVTDGEVNQLATDVIDMVGGYWEFSPSGRGIHGLVMGRLPESGRKKTQLGIEIYNRQRYFTITAKHLSWTSPKLEYRQRGINALHKMVFGKMEPNTQPKSKAVSRNNQTVIQKALNARNGSKFLKLWEGSLQGYSSHSEADYALASMLAYWTNKDPEQIDSLFRQSGLYRDKWDTIHMTGEGLTYGQMTVNRAIENSKQYGGKR